MGSPTSLGVLYRCNERDVLQALQTGNPPATARGTSRGIKNWNHATELLKLHSESVWHRDATMYCRMTEQGKFSCGQRMKERNKTLFA